MSESWSTSGVDLLLDVDPALPRRAGLEQALRDLVRSGRLAAGTRLPSSRTLAAQLAMSRGTVSAAFDQLVAEGYLDVRQGSGTRVAALPAGRSVDVTAPPADAEARFDLRPGSPDLSSFPSAAWLRSVRRSLGSAPTDALGYGDPAGRVELRVALVDYLARTRGVVASADQIVLTTGAVQAIGLLAAVTAGGRGSAVAMEDPGLAFHRDVVAATGARVVALPVDDRGARTDLLSHSRSRRLDAVVVTPAHQYPTGVTLQPERRHALVDWARSSGGLVIEDDYDGEFRYDRQPVGSVQGTAPDQVAYVGSTAKTLGPALRIGWAVVPRRLVPAVREAKRLADRQSSSLDQLALADLVTSHGYDRHVRGMRQRYRQRRDQLLATLQRPGGHTVGGVEVRGIAAGLHALVHLDPERHPEADVVARAAALGLRVSGLAPHFQRPGPHPGGLVVGYAAPSPGGYRAALAALARALAG